MKAHAITSLAALALLLAGPARGQSGKEVAQDALFWTSFEMVGRRTERWGGVAEFQLRRSDFVQDPDFYLLRLGGRYWVRERLTATVGYVRQSNAPDPGKVTWV